MQVINFFIHYNKNFLTYLTKERILNIDFYYIENREEKNEKKVYMYDIFNNPTQIHRSIKIEQIILINLLTCNIFTNFVQLSSIIDSRSYFSRYLQNMIANIVSKFEHSAKIKFI